MPNVTVKLTTPIEGAGDTPITEIVLREPKYRDFVTLGEPAAYARSEGGLLYQSDRDEVIFAYVERLLVPPVEPGLLLQCSLADTIQLKEAVFGFFQAARRATSVSSST